MHNCLHSASEGASRTTQCFSASEQMVCAVYRVKVAIWQQVDLRGSKMQPAVKPHPKGPPRAIKRGGIRKRECTYPHSTQEPILFHQIVCACVRACVRACVCRCLCVGMGYPLRSPCELTFVVPVGRARQTLVQAQVTLRDRMNLVPALGLGQGGVSCVLGVVRIAFSVRVF